MGPESVLIFSLSILAICENSGVYANAVLARKNLHEDVEAARPHSESTSKNDNGPYEKEADPKVASIASAAADASLDITQSLAKEISNAIALAVANSVAKILDERSTQSEQDSEKLSNHIRTASGSIQDDTHSEVKDDLTRTNIGYRSQRKQSEAAHEKDDNEPGLADNTRKFSMTPDADQSKIKRRTFSHDQELASDQGVQINPIANYRRAAIIILQHRNNSRPIYHERRNARRHDHQSIDEKWDDDDDDDAL